MKDDPIKKAADLLLKGERMLEISCPVCNDPIYQLKDKSMFCVTCDKKVVREEDMDISIADNTRENKNSNKTIIKNRFGKTSVNQ